MSIPLPFQSGAWVVLVLQNPRERFWGQLLGLEATGIALRGLDLKPWEEVIRMVMAGEWDQLSLGTRFFPLHRVEQLYLDEPSSGASSLVEEFRRRTGSDPACLMTTEGTGGAP